MELCLPRDDATARAHCWYVRAQTPAAKPCQTRPRSVLNLIVLAVRGGGMSSDQRRVATRNWSGRGHSRFILGRKTLARLILAGRAGPKSSRFHSSSSPNSNPAISVHFYNSTYYPNTK